MKTEKNIPKMMVDIAEPSKNHFAFLNLFVKLPIIEKTENKTVKNKENKNKKEKISPTYSYFGAR